MQFLPWGSWKEKCLEFISPLLWPGRIQGGGGPGPPIFGKVSFIFLHCIQCLKNIFEIEFWFYSGRNPKSFWKCGGVCVCVCLCDPIGLHDKSFIFYLISVGIVTATVFFVLQRPNFEWYPTPFWSQKYMPGWIATNFSKFSEGGPSPCQRSRLRRSVRGFAPLHPPFQNSWIRPSKFVRFKSGWLQYVEHAAKNVYKTCITDLNDLEYRIRTGWAGRGPRWITPSLLQRCVILCHPSALEVFLKWYALYKFTFYLLYLLTLSLASSSHLVSG